MLNLVAESRTDFLFAIFMSFGQFDFQACFDSSNLERVEPVTDESGGTPGAKVVCSSYVSGIGSKAKEAPRERIHEFNLWTRSDGSREFQAAEPKQKTRNPSWPSFPDLFFFMSCAATTRYWKRLEESNLVLLHCQGCGVRDKQGRAPAEAAASPSECHEPEPAGQPASSRYASRGEEL
jgi:hypothetical protein